MSQPHHLTLLNETSVMRQLADTTPKVSTTASDFENDFTGFKLDAAAVELGVFFFLSTLAALGVQDQFRARGSDRLIGWLYRRRFEAFKHQNRNPESIVNLLRVVIWAYSALPLLGLCGWFSLLLYGAIVDKHTVIPAICVLLVSLGFLAIVFHLATVRWNNFRFKTINYVLIPLAIVFLTAYQGLIIFGFETKAKFLPYSVFFLFLNAVTLTQAITLHLDDTEKSVASVLKRFFPAVAGSRYDRDRDGDFVGEIEAQKESEDYRLSYGDLTDIVTIAQVSAVKFKDAIQGGAADSFNSRPAEFKRAIKIIVFVLAELLLVAYGVTLHLADNGNKLGYILAVSIFLMDLFNVLLFLSELITDTLPVLLLLLLNRVLMCGLGEFYWVYGFMVLYLVYSVAFVGAIVRRLYPVAGEIVKDSPRAMSRLLGKRTVADENSFANLAARPEALLLIVTVLYLVIMLVVTYAQFDGLKLQPFIIMGGTPDQKQLEYSTCAALTLAIVVTYFFVSCLLRALVRKATGAERFVQGSGRLGFLRNARFFDTINAFVLINVILFAGWASFAYGMTGSKASFAWFFLFPCLLIAFLKILTYLQANQYWFIARVERLNKFILRHNAKVDKAESNKEKTQEMLLDGKIILPELEEIDDSKTGAARSNMLGASADLEVKSKVTIDDLINREKGNQQILKDQRLNELKQDPGLAGREKQLWQELAQQAAKVSEIDLASKEEKKKEAADARQREHQLSRLKQAQDNQAKANQVQAEEEGKKQNFHEDTRANAANDVDDEVSQNNDERSKWIGTEEGGMYEGGDTTNLAITSAAEETQGELASEFDEETLDPSKVLYDMDTYNAADHKSLAVNVRFRPVVDWRHRHNDSFCAAFAAGDLRPNDYSVISATGWAVFLWLLLLTTLLVVTEGALGAIMCLPMLYIILTSMLTFAIVGQSRLANCGEYAAWFVALGLYLAAGFAYFWVQFDASQLEITTTKRDAKNSVASYFLVFYVLFIPTLAQLEMIIWQLINNGFEGFWAQRKVFVITCCAGLLLLAVSMLLLVHWETSAAFTGAILVIAYILWQLRMYYTNEFDLPTVFKWINGIILAVFVLFSLVYSFAAADLHPYMGLTLSTFALLTVVWGYAILQLVRDYVQRKTNPIFYSRSLQPILKYDAERHDFRPHTGPTGAWLGGLILLYLWSFLTNSQIKPYWFGAIVAIIVELGLLLTVVGVNTVTQSAIDDAFDFCDEDVAKQAWLDTKHGYVKKQGVYSRLELLTYRRLWKRRWNLMNYYQATVNGPAAVKPMPPNLQEELKKEIKANEMSTPRDHYYYKCREFMDESEFKLTDKGDVLILLSRYDLLVREAHNDELELMLQFIMIAAQNARLHQAKVRKDFIKFVGSSTTTGMLLAMGIPIHLPDQGDTDFKWDALQAQIDKLEPAHRQMFERIKLYYVKEKADTMAYSKGRSQEDTEASDARSQAAAKLREARAARAKEFEEQLKKREAQGVTEEDLNLDLNEMPDCRHKYSILVERAKRGMGKFTDGQFPAGAASIGEQLLEYAEDQDGTVSWPRLSEHTNDAGAYLLFEDEADANDIVQGELGDCYYLSALTVLGDERIRKKFVYLNTTDEWETVGAFAVIFFENGREEIVIVDDCMPYYEDASDFCFAKSRTRKELWPNVLEKAFAKKYGSYQAIAKGHVDIALSVLTNGVPEKYEHKKNQNLEKFWLTLVELQKGSCFMGAGTPSHPQGDAHVNDGGLAMGHAYAIIRIKEADGNRLICLRNPWGRGEWNGDWADDSDLWTTRMINLIGYEANGDDGIFWMAFEDFVDEFDQTYVCRNYTKENGWQMLTFEDEWIGSYAQGLPTSANKGAKLRKNPQYELTLSQPGKAFLVYRLKEQLTTFKSVQYGYILVADLNGELIEKMDRKTQLGTAGPVNKVVQTVELNAPRSLSYPHKFTIMCSAMKGGKEGEGSFSVQIYTQDELANTEKLN